MERLETPADLPIEPCRRDLAALKVVMSCSSWWWSPCPQPRGSRRAGSLLAIAACTVGKVLRRRLAPRKDRGKVIRVFVAFSLGERGGVEEGAVSRSISPNAHRTRLGVQPGLVKASELSSQALPAPWRALPCKKQQPRLQDSRSSHRASDPACQLLDPSCDHRWLP